MKKFSVVDKKNFAGRLRQALAESDIETVTELAAIAVVNRPSLYVWLNGRCLPSLEIAYRLATALGVSVDWLTGRTNCKEVSR